jgi:hypothetical protein
MPKVEDMGKSCKMHKIMMGAGMIIFAAVLYMYSSEEALNANLNWPAAIFVMGALLIVKALVFSFKKK